VLWPEKGSFGQVPAGKVAFRYTESAELPSSRDTVVVVPRQARVTPQQWEQLERFIEQGGRAFVLADKGLPYSLGGTPLRSSQRMAVIAHVRCPEHPVVSDLPGAALRYWIGAAGTFYSPPVEREIPDMVIATAVPRKPAQGTYLTLLDAGLGGMARGEPDPGLTQAPLLEIRCGQGRALVCTLLLAEGLRTDEPAAGWLLHRAIRYLQRPDIWVGKPPRPVRVVGTDLTPYGVIQTEDLATAGALVVNAASAEGWEFLKADLRQWWDFAQGGGKVLLHNLSVEQVEELSRLTGVPLQAKALPEQEAPARLDWIRRDPVIRGLAHFDVSWFDTKWLTIINARQPIISVAVSSSDARVKNLTEQGAVLVIPVGQGEVIIDQVLWDAPEFMSDYIRRRARGYITQLLSNLDAATRMPPAAVPQGAPEPQAETIALYHLEQVEPGLLVDGGDSGHDLAVLGAAEFVPGRLGQGLRFTAPDQRAYMRFPAGGLQTPDLTIDFWMKPDTEPNPEGTGAGVILAFWRHGANLDLSVTMTRDGRICFYYPGVPPNHNLVSTSSVWEKDRWTRVTITSSVKNQRTRIYLDGRLDAEAPGAGYYPHGALVLGDPFPGSGEGLWSSGGVDGTFLGVVDEIHLLSTERGPE